MDSDEENPDLWRECGHTLFVFAAHKDPVATLKFHFKVYSQMKVIFRSKFRARCCLVDFKPGNQTVRGSVIALSTERLRLGQEWEFGDGHWSPTVHLVWCLCSCETFSGEIWMNIYAPQIKYWWETRVCSHLPWWASKLCVCVGCHIYECGGRIPDRNVGASRVVILLISPFQHGWGLLMLPPWVLWEDLQAPLASNCYCLYNFGSFVGILRVANSLYFLSHVKEVFLSGDLGLTLPTIPASTPLPPTECFPLEKICT